MRSGADCVLEIKIHRYGRGVYKQRSPHVLSLLGQNLIYHICNNFICIHMNICFSETKCLERDHSQEDIPHMQFFINKNVHTSFGKKLSGHGSIQKDIP